MYLVQIDLKTLIVGKRALNLFVSLVWKPKRAPKYIGLKRERSWKRRRKEETRWVGEGKEVRGRRVGEVRVGGIYLGREKMKLINKG